MKDENMKNMFKAALDLGLLDDRFKVYLVSNDLESKNCFLIVIDTLRLHENDKVFFVEIEEDVGNAMEGINTEAVIYKWKETLPKEDFAYLVDENVSLKEFEDFLFGLREKVELFIDGFYLKESPNLEELNSAFEKYTEG